NFIGTLGYSIILPFLIILVIKFGGNELIYGTIGATYSFFQLIGAPILGRWSDKFGRKKILLLSQAGTFLAWVLFIIALRIPNTTLAHVNSSILGIFIVTIPLLVLFVARALDGITGGNVSVANAYLADVTTEEDRKSNFGKMAASGNLGFIIGPALAGVLGGTVLGEQLPVMVAMMISLIAIFVIAFLLSESNPCVLTKPVESCKVKKVFGQEHKECYEIAGSDRINFREALNLNHIPFILILYFMIFLAFNFFYVAFPVHAVESLKWSLLGLGIFFSVLGFIMVCVQGPVLSKISNKFSDSILTIAGSTLLAGSFFLFTSSNKVLIYLGVLLFSSGNGIMWPSFLSILSKVAGKKYQGAIQGYASSSGSLASIIGLITGGLIYGWVGVTTFWIPGILLLTIFVLSFKLVGIEQTYAAKIDD
ncbi:MFS transporter, partial [candidate division KSB1 bacterium]|nr:MFS transporter [candidate division KSB1 bacterium]NIV69286.1 MFS transporter [Phycisphaerae bacterium]NIR68552.1 MFS transporter [candidate division KSB1 bacterium]NIS22558.1 MFS transporter [candidate division KSB1 bacterium]NIT69401.1 MFS transporter [candidate division KSB1 bacterium]